MEQDLSLCQHWLSEGANWSVIMLISHHVCREQLSAPLTPTVFFFQNQAFSIFALCYSVCVFYAPQAFSMCVPGVQQHFFFISKCKCLSIFHLKDNWIHSPLVFKAYWGYFNQFKYSRHSFHGMEWIKLYIEAFMLLMDPFKHNTDTRS